MGFKDQIDEINLKINISINFVINKLQNYSRLSLGEQISYPTVGIGLILIIVAIVMFII